MPKTQFGLSVSKLCFGICLLICLLLPVSVIFARQPTDQVVHYDPVAITLLEKLKADNLLPYNKHTWQFADYDLWQGTVWSKEDPRQLVELSLSNHVFTERGHAPNMPINREKVALKGNFVISDLPHLQVLTIGAQLEMGPKLWISGIKIQDLPELRELYFTTNHKGDILENLINLPKLEVLDLYFNAIGDMRRLAVLDTPNLRYLNLTHNGIRRAEMPDNLQQLKELNLSFNNIREIALDNLPILESLNLSENGSLIRLYGLDKLSALKKLDISETGVTKLEGLDNLFALEELRADKLWRLQAIEGLDNLMNLRALHIGNSEAKQLKGLDTLVNLRELYLGGHFAKLEGLDNLPNLHSLTIIGNMPKMEGLDNLDALQELTLYGNFAKIEGLDNLTNLEKLTLGREGITRIEGLDKLVNLKSLTLTSKNISRIENLDNLTSLEVLSFTGKPPIDKVENMGALVNLKELNMPECQLSDITGLNELSQLETLNLARNKLDTFSNLKPMPTLKNLNLRGNRIVDNLDSLEGCPNLEVLDIVGIGLTSLKPLLGLPKLKELALSISRLESLDGIEQLSNLQKLCLNHAKLTNIKTLPPNLRELQIEQSAINNLDFLVAESKPLSLQKLLAKKSEIAGTADFSRAVNLKHIDLEDCKLAGITGFEHLPFDAFVKLKNNSLPLSQIYPLMQDVSKRTWQLGWQRNVFFEKLELKRNQPLDLSSEKEFGGIRTGYSVKRLTIAKGQQEWVYLNQGEAFNVTDGVITFLEPGQYQVTMINKTCMLPGDRQKEPYPISVNTGIITVPEDRQLTELNLAGRGLADLETLVPQGSVRKSLQTLYVQNNQLSGTVDLSGFKGLTKLELSQNKISAFTGYKDLPANAEVFVYDNRLPLSQLYRLIQETKCTWHYNVQKGVFADKQKLKVGEPLDLSSEKLLGSTETRFIVYSFYKHYRYKEPQITFYENGVDYAEENGVITFKLPGEYFIKMENDALPYTTTDTPEPMYVETGKIKVE